MLSPLTSSADDRKREHRRGEPKVEIKDNGKNYKYEYKDGRCKYEYHLNYRTGEEKTEKKGDCRGVSPRRAVYGSHDDEHSHHDRNDRRHGHGADVPVRSMSCNREMIGRVVGGVLGGVAGSQIGSGSGREVATVAGAIVGVLMAGHIGKRMDHADAGCAYQAFEFADDQERVVWTNPALNIEYGVTPLRRLRDANGRECREYEASAHSGSSRDVTRGIACRLANGAWDVQLR